MHEVLPPQIADKLQCGEEVQPEFFECVTIYFSEIVDFTEISSRSSPAEIMALLNELFVMFDSNIEEHDVYKADVIGKYACSQCKVKLI